MSLESEYKKFETLHAKYELRALKSLLKEFRILFKSINFNNLSFDPKITESVIELNINDAALEKIIFKIHYTSGKEYGNIIARQLRKENTIHQKKWNPLPLFNEAFQQFLIEYYRTYGGENITLLSQTIAKTIADEIISGTYENETVQEMQTRIRKLVNSSYFYKWQALRIARTETTFAMNSAKEIAGSVSGVLMNKIWIGRNDGRERQSHIEENNKSADENGIFTVGRSKMRYPGDRTLGAEAKELIQCRCTFGFVAQRDENGRLIFTD